MSEDDTGKKITGRLRQLCQERNVGTAFQRVLENLKKAVPCYTCKGLPDLIIRMDDPTGRNVIVVELGCPSSEHGFTHRAIYPGDMEFSDLYLDGMINSWNRGSHPDLDCPGIVSKRWIEVASG